MCHRRFRCRATCRRSPRVSPRGRRWQQLRRSHLPHRRPLHLHLSRCFPRCPEHPARELTQHRRPEVTVASTRNLSKGLAAVATATAAAFGLCPSAAADPATPPPNPTQGLPGLPALAQLSPIIQQAASNPAQATQLLMAAAEAFTHNPTAPTESRNVAASVNQFVQEPTNPNPGSPPLGVAAPGAPAPAPNGVTPPDTSPVPHVPPAGVEPGTQAHLPTGIDPAHAAGPAPVAAPAATPPVSAPAPGTVVPAAAPGAAPAPAPAPPAPATPPPGPAAPATRARAGASRSCAGRRPRGSPGFWPRRPAHAGLHVSLDRHQLPCGRQ